MLNIPQSHQLVTVTVLGDFSASWPDLLFLLLLLEVNFFTFVDCRIRETSNRTVISQKGQGYPKRVWDILCGSNVASPPVTHWSHLWNLSIHVYIILNILLPCSGMKSAPWRVLGACAAPGEGTGCWASPGPARVTEPCWWHYSRWSSERGQESHFPGYFLISCSLHSCT